MVADTAAPAARLAKPSWKDPRLLVGVLLVLAAVAGTVALVSGADKSVDVYVARDTIVVGQPLTPDSFDRVGVRLGDADGKYVRAGAQLPENAVAVRMVPKGELVARSSVGGVDGLDRKPASLSVTEPLPRQVVVGAHVDVWVALPDDRNGYQKPELMLPGVEVAELDSAATALGTGKTTQLMVLVSDAQMPRILGALANKARVSVVWNAAAAQ
ncbi:hypothetical protein [Specibacter cremeus]|uniref:hypothetical protein n=1 Tax=Specibacter cremeus TaxID=1629051 RepID=UPI000F7ADB48|nr:hypothetical protein [Specibacter cremeus]